MRIKIKLKTLTILSVLAILTLIGYFLLLPKPFYNDCGKSFEGFDVLFVYTQACPHCKADLERIKELNLIEKFYMVDAEDFKCRNIINSYSDYIIYHKKSNLQNIPAGIFTPTKVSLCNNSTFVGEQTKEEIKRWYEENVLNCKK